MHTITKGVILVLVSVLLNSCSTPVENKVNNSKSDKVATKVIEEKKKVDLIQQPQNQSKFIKIHRDYEEGFSLTTNTIKHNKIFKGRGTELYNLLMKDSLIVSNWFGVVRYLGEDADGNFSLGVKINNDRIRISTARKINNVQRIQTQIVKKTPLFESLSVLEIGDTVVFSGRFFIDGRKTKPLKPINIIKEHEALFFEDPIETKMKESNYIFEFHSFEKKSNISN